MEDAVTVSEIMTRDYLGVSESDPVDEAVALMREEEVSGVVVQRGSEPVGMLTAADALGLLTANGRAADTAVGEVMSATVPSIDPTAPVIRAAGEMADEGIGSLLVTDGDAIVGVVSERDVVQAMATLADHSAVADPREPAAATGAGAVEAPESGSEQLEDEYARTTTESDDSIQSVCEICGALTPDLHNFNGKLICGDCREI